MFRATFIVFPLLFVGCADPQGIGGACSSDDDCQSGLECLREMPGGMCSQTCEDECPDGSVCVDLAGQGYCFRACDGDGDCRGGYTCSMGHCDLPCEDDEECPEHARCDDGGCRYREDQPLGDACLMDEQCATGRCLLDGLTGYCTETCGGSELCGDRGLFCGKDAACFSGRCRKRCKVNQDCPRRHGKPGRCQLRTVRKTKLGLCF